LSRHFFTDRDLGKQFPEILRAAGVSVERHGDRFAPDGSDEEWLEYCGGSGRVAISHNRRIRHTPNELAALVRHRAMLLIIIGNAPVRELARNFVHTLPKIEALLSRNEPPLVARIYRPSPAEIARNPEASGSVAIWYPPTK